jgi:DNA-binding NtrC family response regulator
VYGFVNQSRGAVSIDSRVGQGTAVTLYLPQLEDAAAAATDEDERADETIPPGLRVMLVEDDAEVRKVVHTFLTTLGCEVFTAATAEQALSALDAGVGPLDLLLSDIALGAGMRGTRLASEVQQRFPRMAVLLMSGFSSELLDADREVPQSWELLRKPYARSELARAMAKVLAGRA